jgi:predicted secreted protein
MSASRIRQDVKSTILSQAISGDVDSSASDLRDMEGYAIQFTWSGGSGFSGNLELQASVDGTNYSPVTDSQQAITGATGTHVWNVHDHHYSYVKVVLSGVSGTASSAQIVFSARARA